MEYGFIYETTNILTGNKYIGQHRRYQNLDDPDDSWYLGSGTIISSAIKRYGKENFKRVILCDCCSDRELNEMEEYYINKYDAVNDHLYYNMIPGGNAPRTIPEGTRRKMSEAHKGKHLSEGLRKKISISVSIAVMGEKNHYYGKTLSEDHRRKMSEAHKGKPKSEETKTNMSKASKTNIGFSRCYTLTCKKCGVQFSENKPSYKFCVKCR